MIFTNEQGVLEHDTFTPVPGTRQPNWVELHRLNRVWRQWMDEHSQFVTPDTIDTLCYMSEECHEALKCWMVARLPDHPRRQQPDKTIGQEFAQPIMLALTALPAIDFTEAEREGLQYSDMRPIINICSLANRAVEECELQLGGWAAYTHGLLLAVATWPGLDIAAELRRCWAALAWRHASYHMHEYPQELR